MRLSFGHRRTSSDVSADTENRAGPRWRATRLAGVGLTAIVAFGAGLVLDAPHALATATFPGYSITYPATQSGGIYQGIIGPDGSVSVSSHYEGSVATSPALARQYDGSIIGAYKAGGFLYYFTSAADSDQHLATDHRFTKGSDDRYFVDAVGTPAVAATNGDLYGNGGGIDEKAWAIAINRRMTNDTHTATTNKLEIIGSGVDYCYFDPDFPCDTGDLMLPGSSPAIAAIPFAPSYFPFVVAFLNPDGRLRIRNGSTTQIGDAPGGAGLTPALNTNPAIATDNNGAWMAALHGANNDNLWTLDSNGRVTQTAAVLAPNTSPAIVGLAHGGYAIAYVNADGTLWKDIRVCISCSDVLSPAGPWQAVPAPGSSPSVAADNSGGWEIAAQGANNHYVWTIDSAGHMNSTQQVMFNGTESPAIAGIPTPDYDPTTGFEADSITYDIAHAAVTSNNLDQLDKVTTRNDSAVQQSTTVSGSKTIAEQEGWSRTEATAVHVSATFSTGIPIFVDGKVSVDTTVTDSYTESGSVTRTEVFSWSQPVLVPPRSVMNATVIVTHATVLVPYTLTGTFINRGGARVAGTLHGTFTGASSSNLEVVLTQSTLDGTPAAAPVPQPAPALLNESVNQ